MIVKLPSTNSFSSRTIQISTNFDESGLSKAKSSTKNNRGVKLGWRQPAAATNKQRKWQPHFSKRTYARSKVDLTDTITDAHMNAFFGSESLDLNAANSRFTGNSGKTIRKIPKGAQHARALVNEAAARRVLSNRGKPEYARLWMSLDSL